MDQFSRNDVQLQKYLDGDSKVKNNIILKNYKKSIKKNKLINPCNIMNSLFFGVYNKDKHVKGNVKRINKILLMKKEMYCNIFFDFETTQVFDEQNFKVDSLHDHHR